MSTAIPTDEADQPVRMHKPQWTCLLFRSDVGVGEGEELVSRDLYLAKIQPHVPNYKLKLLGLVVVCEGARTFILPLKWQAMVRRFFQTQTMSQTRLDINPLLTAHSSGLPRLQALSTPARLSWCQWRQWSRIDRAPYTSRKHFCKTT